MFTGIIEEIGEVKKIEKNKLIIEFNKISDLKLGDSVSVNGVCLTVQKLGKDFFESSVMPVTLQKTSLGCLKRQDRVNLERAVKPQGFMGGHFVLGHVDGIGKVLKKGKDSNVVRLTIGFPKELSCYFVPQGPVTVDGVSLTIAELAKESFEVSLVPHTIDVTNLNSKREGDIINLEADILAKYVKKILSPARITMSKSGSALGEPFNSSLSQKEGKAIDSDFLKSCGY